MEHQVSSFISVNFLKYLILFDCYTGQVLLYTLNRSDERRQPYLVPGFREKESGLFLSWSSWLDVYQLSHFTQDATSGFIYFFYCFPVFCFIDFFSDTNLQTHNVRVFSSHAGMQKILLDSSLDVFLLECHYTANQSLPIKD